MEFDPSELCGNSRPSFPLSRISELPCNHCRRRALALVYPPLPVTFRRPIATVRSCQPPLARTSTRHPWRPPSPSPTSYPLLHRDRCCILYFPTVGVEPSSASSLAFIAPSCSSSPRHLVLLVPGTAQGFQDGKASKGDQPPPYHLMAA